ncbi:MAG: cytochrome c oxidase assembly factor Coa1 family protein [Pirellulaceae bacterium]
MSTPGNFDPNLPPPQRSSGGGSVLMIVLIVVGVLLLTCAGICGGCIYVMQVGMQEAGTEIGAIIELTPTTKRAVEIAKTDPQVLDRLGNPIAAVGVPVRDGQGEIDPVHESFHVDLRGSQESGKLVGHATKVQGAWKLTELTVECSDGTKLNVPLPEESPLELQFDVPPPEATN